MGMGDDKHLARSRDLRHMLNGEWLTHILVALSAGPLHYNELHAAIQDMTTFDPWTGTVRKIQSRALGRTLRRMETAGLVDRVEERTFPRSVVYSLTPAAADLLVRAQPLIDWAEENLDLIERLQKTLEDGDPPQGDDRSD
ncbi:winged helix-turn-helix transcriptional regulator [Lentzea aerocolonigenes]|uniref:winged helix-turn-helix transcriptional regulator n=2 Tax=Lentzea aerocolonigenes TaxID=68170 RepID=UPI0034E1F8B8